MYIGNKWALFGDKLTARYDFSASMRSSVSIILGLLSSAVDASLDAADLKVFVEKDSLE